jgi:hypothetical protein
VVCRRRFHVPRWQDHIDSDRLDLHTHEAAKSAMKLTPAQIKQVEEQTESRPIPDDEPVVAQLMEAFGEHTFYLQTDGLHILVHHADHAAEGQVANVVRVAQWSDEEADALVPQEPEPTDMYVDLLSGPAESES